MNGSCCSSQVLSEALAEKEGCTNPGSQVAVATQSDAKYLRVLSTELVTCHRPGDYSFEVAPRLLEICAVRLRKYAMLLAAIHGNRPKSKETDARQQYPLDGFSTGLTKS